MATFARSGFVSRLGRDCLWQASSSLRQRQWASTATRVVPQSGIPPELVTSVPPTKKARVSKTTSSASKPAAVRTKASNVEKVVKPAAVKAPRATTPRKKTDTVTASKPRAVRKTVAKAETGEAKAPPISSTTAASQTNVKVSDSSPAPNPVASTTPKAPAASSSELLPAAIGDKEQPGTKHSAPAPALPKSAQATDQSPGSGPGATTARPLTSTGQSSKKADTALRTSATDSSEAEPETPEARIRRGQAAAAHVAQGGKLPPRYAGAARRITAIIVALPFVIVGTPLVWERVVEGKERKVWPRAEGVKVTLEDAGGLSPPKDGDVSAAT